jgi:predicted nucleic acid-binding Zn ribbon protein
LKEKMEHPYKQRKVNGRKIDEHRLIMEQILGRKLESFEHVHHINGKRKDNRPENLVVLTKSNHSKLHKPQILPSIKRCVICGEEFTPHPTKRRRQQTCSTECKIELMKKNSTSAKVSKLDRSRIKDRFANGEMGNVLAREYNITPQAISYIIHH